MLLNFTALVFCLYGEVVLCYLSGPHPLNDKTNTLGPPLAVPVGPDALNDKTNTLGPPLAEPVGPDPLNDKTNTFGPPLAEPSVLCSL